MKINIAKYLLELLLDRGNITVPGLGNFELKKNAASFGEGRKSLLPPKSEFIFHEEHDNEDDSFRDHLIKQENLDPVKADQFVSKFTSDILKGLMAKELVEIAYLGTLKRNEGLGTVSFKQNEATISKLNKLLPEVSLPEPKAVGAIPKMEVPVPVESKSTVAAIATPTPINTKAKIEEQPIFAEPKKTPWLRWILGAILLGACFVLGVKMCSTEDANVYRTTEEQSAIVEKVEEGQGSDETEVEAGTEISQTVENIPNETNSSNKEVESAEAISNASNSTNSDKVSIDLYPNNASCIVIVASMQNKQNVSQLLGRIKDKDYTPYTEAHGAYTRVGVQVNCNDLEESYRAFIGKVSSDFSVNAWSLTPEYKQ